jgi:hypothetical protein
VNHYRTNIGSRRIRNGRPEQETFVLLLLGLASLSSLIWIAFFAFINARAVGLI